MSAIELTSSLEQLEGSFLCYKPISLKLFTVHTSIWLKGNLSPVIFVMRDITVFPEGTFLCCQEGYSKEEKSQNIKLKDFTEHTKYINICYVNNLCRESRVYNNSYESHQRWYRSNQNWNSNCIGLAFETKEQW